MALEPSPIPVLGTWHLSVSSCCYLLACVGFALAFRALFALFRTWAILKGDYPGAKPENKPTTFMQAYKWCWWGCNPFKEHSDLWLPTFIGFAEIASFPVLIVLGQYSLIGGWIVIKTAGQWSGWTKSRTSFNRFLLANILNLSVGYFLLSHLIKLNK